jgi:DNA polymerase elongation subunit (family B)
MEHTLQPCDWYEHDTAGKYVVDVFGRTSKGKVACVRINGFKPYFYVKCEKKPTVGTSSEVEKYDVFAGFSDLKKTKVWKVVCDTKSKCMEATKSIQGVFYETNLPAFMRLFHERDLGPASPFRFKGGQFTIPCDRETEEPLYNIDEFYQCDVNDVYPAPTANIPLKVACYDLEMYSKSGMFPQALKDDPIVQMGISYRWSDKMLDPIRKVVYVVGDVDESEEKDVEFVGCRDEEDMLFRFAHEIRSQNPDVMCGYNTFGFDDAYIEDRCKRLGILDEVDFSRYQSKIKIGDNWRVKFSETKKFELASGKYDLRFLTLRGRLGLDLLLNMRREHSLDSFKLDSVASVFLRDKVTDYKDGRITTKSTRGLGVGNFVRFDIVGNTTDPYKEGEKYRVTGVDTKGFTIDAPRELFTDLSDKDRKSLEWTFSKDDVEPHELFELHAHGGPAGRARIAKYCIQDCDLVLTLMAKLDTIVNCRGMADVCKVPMEYVLRRGQGIKIFSAVVFYASQRDQILRVQHAIDDDTGYEGAIVLPPKIGMYLDQPISVLDFNSLYPTNMISYNLSPDTFICERAFDNDGNKTFHDGLPQTEVAVLKEKGYVLEDIEYDNKDEKGNVSGKTICTFVQPNDNPMTVGVLPKTLDILLKKRKEFKEKMEDASYDESQRSVFNGLQLAYKVVANSVYGQCGSRTSPIRKLCVAASTTAAGRKALNLAKHIVETEFGAEVIYGDTDSIFIKFPTKDLAESIQLGLASGKRITSQCRKPYKIAYEKTFYPFILFCRKRYVGMKYEEDVTKCKRMSMGIVLKRRDNAPIVKDVFGGALDMLLTEKDVRKAQQFVQGKLLDVLENRVPLEKFIVSKSLRDDYITEVPDDIRKHRPTDNVGNPVSKPPALNEKKAPFNVIKDYSEKYGLSLPASSIAHRTLADRMERRDAGTAPKVGDRLQFIYVAENKTAAKQGDRIEEVGYVRKNGLTPDASFYITNQIQNPVAQLFALCIDKLEGYAPPRRPSYTTIYEQLLEKYGGDEEEATRALLDKKERQLESIMFLGSPHLLKVVRKNTRGPMDAFLVKK